MRSSGGQTDVEALWSWGGAPISQPAAIAESASDSAPIRFEELIERCLGDDELAGRVLRRFQTTVAAELESLEQAETSEAVFRLAHKLRGTCANAAARKMAQIMAQLEMLGCTGRMAELPPYIEAARREFARIAQYVAARGRVIESRAVTDRDTSGEFQAGGEFTTCAC